MNAQKQLVDKALEMYSKDKRAVVKRHRIASVTNDTEYYKIDSILINDIDGLEADTKVTLKHKKYNLPVGIMGN